MQQQVTKKAILSAKDAVKSAKDKLTKIAMDMDSSENMPSPDQVKEIVQGIADVAQEIVQQADAVAQGLETGNGDVNDEGETGDMNSIPEEAKARMAAQEEEIKDLKKFKETSEKEKMATEYSNLFPAAQKSAKYTEFMKMDNPNSELRTVLSATETALTSIKNASSKQIKSNETIIFQSNQKNASMNGMGLANSLSEI